MRLRYIYFETSMVFIMLIIVSLTGCASQKRIPDALVELPFENSLDNLGQAAVQGDVYSGEIKYLKGKHGMALQTQGDGSWVAIHPKNKIDFGDLVEISFSFKRENWENPYVAGSGVQTIATVSGKDEKRIDHLSFGFVPGSSLSFYVYFTDDKVESHRISTPTGSVRFNWHHIRLLIDFKEETTSLYYDDNLVSQEPALPVALSKGIDRIILGTWHRKNQAYRGLIDDFVIRDIHSSQASTK
jgi:hypothetical protein